MTDALTHDETIESYFPPLTGFVSPEQLMESRWTAAGFAAGTLVEISTFQCTENPGFFHYSINIGGERLETLRPVKACVVGHMINAALAPEGLSVADFQWRPVDTWDRVRPPKKPREEPVVYFAAAGPFIKIGKGSGDASKRARELQTGCPYPITVLATMPGGVSEEQALHRRFASLRAHGEWFRADPALLNFINTIAGGA